MDRSILLGSIFYFTDTVNSLKSVNSTDFCAINNLNCRFIIWQLVQLVSFFCCFSFFLSILTYYYPILNNLITFLTILPNSWHFHWNNLKCNLGKSDIFIILNLLILFLYFIPILFMQGYFYISVAFSNFLQVDLVHLLVNLFLGTSSVNTFVNESIMFSDCV